MTAGHRLHALPRFSPWLSLVLAAIACNAPGSATTESILTEAPAAFDLPSTRAAAPTLRPSVEVSSPTMPAPSETPVPTPTPTPIGVYKIAVIVDLSSEPVDRVEFDAVLVETNGILQALSGIVFEVVNFVELTPEPGAARGGLGQVYLDSKPAIWPNGILLLSHGNDDFSRARGGMSRTASLFGAWRNDFALEGRWGTVPVAVVDWKHEYGRCGYGGGFEPVSEISTEGECAGEIGTTCVWKFDYPMCPQFIEDRYAETRTAFTSATIIHEFMHQFDPGALGHYGSEACQEALGEPPITDWSAAMLEFQRYNGMCPKLYEIFASSRPES